MDIQSALSSLLSALKVSASQAAQAAQAVQGAQPDLAAPQLPALLALMGQDVNLVFLGTGEDGQRLALPSGQVFTAKGELGYPDGTQLLVRIQGGSASIGALRLQTLEALPPPPAAILAPLLQGEGAALLNRLGQADPGPGLAALGELFQALRGEPAVQAPDAPAPAQAQATPVPGDAQAASVPGDAQAASVPGDAQAAPVPGQTQATQGPGQGQASPGPGPAAPALGRQPASQSTPAMAKEPAMALPSRGQLQAALELLPAPAQAALRTSLALGPGEALAPALEAWLSEALAAHPAAGALAPALLQRLQTSLDHHPELPAAPREALASWLKNLLAPGAEAEHRPVAPPAKAARAQDLPSQPLEALLRARPALTPDLPETWQSWIKATIKTLADPVASPREAPFHAAQAKEGTAFYEIPLPWAPHSPMQLWVESDPGEKGRGGSREQTRTVLLGLKFTRLGETRLGIAKGPAGLQVRVWAEHPECLAPVQQQMEAELQSLGGSVDLKILPLRPGPGGFVPSLRSLVTGPTVQMLG